MTLGYLLEFAMGKIRWYTENHTCNVMEFTPASYVDSKLKFIIHNLKNKLNKIENKKLCSARKRYDGYFINGIPRGAIKMANLDAIFKLTKNISSFGDICGGPGGFVDFILFQNPKVIGYGMTLITDKYYVTSTRFTSIYGVKNDGNILDKQNLEIFPKNLDILFADGGLDVNGNENAQETLHSELFITEVRFGLTCLKPNGTFVMKFFDTHTKESVNLLYLLSTAFNMICIHKPESSRPANSERYVICKGKKADISKQLQILNDNIGDIKITHRFYNYICERNNHLAKLQIDGLRRLLLFTKRPHLKRSPSFRRQWRLDKFLFSKNVNRNRDLY